MPTVQDIINTALGEVGVTEYPPNSNNVKYNTAFYGHPVQDGVPTKKDKYPWCCAGVWWVFAQHDPCLVKKTASCQDLGTWFNTNGRWHSNPQIGDVVFFKFNTNDRWTNHVGIVKDIKGSMIETIEFNTSVSSDDNGGAVMVRQRSSNIVGYGRPAYDSDEPLMSQFDDGYVHGIDISKFQGKIDFEKVKEAGIEFVWLRTIIEDLSVDPMFDTYLAECLKYDFHINYYKYCYAKTHDEARREADLTINLIKDHKKFVWYDMENTAVAALGKDAIEGIVLSFIGECKEAGIEAGIYCNKVWYENYISDYLKDHFKFWIARYPKEDHGQLREDLKPAWKNVVAWQYSSKGRVPGITTNVDLDVILR